MIFVLLKMIGKNPSVGAAGLGWEVWYNGMEITQFTYMQQVGGISLDLIAGELQV